MSSSSRLVPLQPFRVDPTDAVMEPEPESATYSERSAAFSGAGPSVPQTALKMTAPKSTPVNDLAQRVFQMLDQRDGARNPSVDAKEPEGNTSGNLFDRFYREVDARKSLVKAPADDGKAVGLPAIPVNPTPTQVRSTAASAATATAGLDAMRTQLQQSHVVFELTHLSQRPVSDKPGVCILACLPSADAAADWIRTNHRKELGSFYTRHTHDWIPICVNDVDSNDDEKRNAIRDKIMNAYTRSLCESDQEFEKMREAKKAGVAHKSIDATLRKVDDKFKASTRSKALAQQFKNRTANMKKVEVVAPAPAHKFAVVAFMQDLVGDPARKEPLFVVMGAFSEMDGAKACMTECSKLISDTNFEIVDMGKWLFPQHTDRSKVSTEYRDQKVQEMMDYRKIEESYSSEAQAILDGKGLPAPSGSAGTTATVATATPKPASRPKIRKI